MSGFIFKLQNVMTMHSQSNSADSQIAKLLLQNMELAHKNVTISQIAKACYTSVSSISRFATNLGYSSFNEMKADFIGMEAEFEELQVDNSFLNDHSLHQFKDRIIESLHGISEINLKQHTLWLSEMVYNSKNVYLFATHIPSDIIAIMHRAILATGKYINFIQDKHEQMRIVHNATSNDLFIIVSLDGTLVMEKEITIPLIRTDATRILVTQNVNMKFSSYFSHVIPLGDRTDNFTAKYKLMLFVDYFINTYINYSSKQKELDYLKEKS